MYMEGKYCNESSSDCVCEGMGGGGGGGSLSPFEPADRFSLNLA